MNLALRAVREISSTPLLLPWVSESRIAYEYVRQSTEADITQANTSSAWFAYAVHHHAGPIWSFPTETIRRRYQLSIMRMLLISSCSFLAG